MKGKGRLATKISFDHEVPWTSNSDKKLNVHKPCVTSPKQPFESFAKFFVNFQDVASFGKILKKFIANFGKISRKEKILLNFCKI